MSTGNLENNTEDDKSMQALRSSQELLDLKVDNYDIKNSYLHHAGLKSRTLASKVQHSKSSFEQPKNHNEFKAS